MLTRQPEDDEEAQIHLPRLVVKIRVPELSDPKHRDCREEQPRRGAHPPPDNIGDADCIGRETAQGGWREEVGEMVLALWLLERNQWPSSLRWIDRWVDR